jgi:phage repressor protein C with HTH and peptisase S24 domain
MPMDNFVRYFRELSGLTQSDLGERIGKNRQYISRLETEDPKNAIKLSPYIAQLLAPHVKTTASKLLFGPSDDKEKSLTQPMRAVDDTQTVVKSRPPHSEDASNIIPAPSYSEKMIPVLGTGQGGRKGCFILNGQAMFYTHCPPGLEGEKDIFGLIYRGECLYPRYEDGELLYAMPHRKAVKGDYVAVEMQSEEWDKGEALIKHFKAETPTSIILEQYNPKKTFKINKIEIKRISVIYKPGKS